jgi:peptide/nickel transport system permease protein
MRAFIVRRLVMSVLVMLGTTMVAFAAVRAVPADVVDLILGRRKTPELEAALRHRLGLDVAPVEQYARWLAGVVRGDLGHSLRTDQPVSELLRQRLPVTIELALLASVVSLAVGLPTGVIAAIRQYSLADKAATVASMLGISIPDFWLATLLIMVFSVGYGLLPSAGALPSFSEDLLGNLKRMILPALALGLPITAAYFRMMRSAMLEVIRSDYITTAFSKGLTERRVIARHALKNALIPVVTVVGLEATWMLGGSFIIETIFSLPGLGRATIQAIQMRDLTVLQGCLLVYSLLVVGMAIVVDLVYGWLDPRIRFD